MLNFELDIWVASHLWCQKEIISKYRNWQYWNVKKKIGSKEQQILPQKDFSSRSRSKQIVCDKNTFRWWLMDELRNSMAAVTTEVDHSAGNSTTMDSRRNEIADRLQKREEERLDDIQKRRVEKESAGVVSETTEFFRENFSRTKKEIEDMLETSTSVAKTELAAHFDTTTVLLQKLQKYLTDSAMFLPTFELQKAQLAISKFHGNWHDLLAVWRCTATWRSSFWFTAVARMAKIVGLWCLHTSPIDALLLFHTSWWLSVLRQIHLLLHVWISVFADKLQSDVQEKRDQLLPKKKFAFKGRKKAEKSQTAATPASERVKKELNIAISDCNFADVADQTLVKNPHEVTNQDVALTRLTNCVIKLFGSPGAVHISNLKNCRVFSGPVSGSIFIDQCTGCVFVMPCQQMRIHSTTSTDFYIHVTSKAIIEDCQKVRFAPYNWMYDTIEKHYEISKLDRERNNWRDVDDFNWLASDTHSPNWSELPERDRVLHWNWLTSFSTIFGVGRLVVSKQLFPIFCPQNPQVPVKSFESWKWCFLRRPKSTNKLCALKFGTHNFVVLPTFSGKTEENIPGWPFILLENSTYFPKREEIMNSFW